MSARGLSRQRSLSNQRSTQPHPYSAKGKENAALGTFEPCAATGSLFLYAEGSAVVCLHHDTLALERRFEKHTENIQFICVDNVSERGQGRLVVTYDVGRTAIVWDLMTGDQISRFASYEPLTAAAWMRNGNLTFGNEKGELILFEPATSEHISARTIFDPVTAIAPSSDCKTFAIGYRNGSILLASLLPNFTILHTLSTSRAPSQISALSWHASSSKQKSDMLATNTIDGDLRVWSVAKPPGSAQPRVIRSLHRSDSFLPSQSWICWSKNGRILQLYEGVTWSWDVRTKDVTYQSIPTVEFVKGIAAYGPTGTLFTLGPDHTIQQYDVDVPQMVANVRHSPRNNVPQTPPPPPLPPTSIKSGSEKSYMSPRRELRYGAESATLGITRHESPRHTHKRSASHGSQPAELRLQEMHSPIAKTERSITTISAGAQSNPLSQPYSPSSSKPARQQSRLRQEVTKQPEGKPVSDLFPFTQARLSDVPFQQPRTTDSLTPDALRKQMLNLVFGWQDDIHSLISDELARHPSDSSNAVFLARWLDLEPNETADAFKSATSDLAVDWMRLALNCIDNHPGTKKMAQIFIQKLLTQGDVHAAVCLLMSIGEYNDAIEVYVSRNFHMEAVLLTCVLLPSDWHRLSHLVTRWGEHVIEESQHHLAVRCFASAGVESTEPWTSPTAQTAAQSLKDKLPQTQPSIYHKTMERRGLQDPSPQSSSAPQVSLQVPGANKGRPLLQDGGLKLITSFGSNDAFKFPGLMSDEGTPINAALVTPIAESALPRSAVSPGGLGSYRLNNMRSLSSALASRTSTPGNSHKNRLPSIGETAVDVEIPPYPLGLVPRAPPTPADSGSDREKMRAGQVNPDKKAAQAQLHTLTPARYDPKAPPGADTPQTAVVSQSQMSFTDRLPLDIERSASARPRGSSRNRKPEGLSVSTTATHETQNSQELLQPAVYGESIRRPATTSASFASTKSEISPPNTGNSLASLRSAKSPVSTSGRSLDQYISSLEQAQYYKSSRSRGNSVASKQSRDEMGERRYKPQTHELGEDRERTSISGIPPAKRSPSSPVPMSPTELRLHSESVESLDTYLSTTSATNQTDGGIGPRAPFVKDDDFARHGSPRSRRSRSRAESKTRHGSRAASRRRSPEREAGKRGRSKSRKEGSSTRSPESPVPMVPSEEDLQNTQIVDPALKFVAQNRQRLNRSSSRRESSEQRATRVRSRSRQPEASDSGLARKSSTSMRSERRHQQDSSLDLPQTESADTGLDVVSSTSEAERKGLKNLHQLPHGRRKELAQAELEARRLSLTRRPSAPMVPLPGHHASGFLTMNHAPLLARAQTDQGPITLASLGSPQPVRSDSAGYGRPRPQTPRAMKHPAHGQKSVPDLPPTEEYLNKSMYHPPPPLPDISILSPRLGRSKSFTSPEIPFDMPTHHAFNANIAVSQNRNLSPARGPSRGPSRERRAQLDARSDFHVLTVGEEEEFAYPVSVDHGPPVVPELQHLAIPPPPPPPPMPPMPFLEEQPRTDFMSGLRIQTENLSSAANIPLPQSAYPGDYANASGPSDRLRREKSVSGKIRNFAGRVRSTSRGRSQSRGRDNPARSPNPNGDESISPYESLSAAQQAHFPLATVTEGR